MLEIIKKSKEKGQSWLSLATLKKHLVAIKRVESHSLRTVVLADLQWPWKELTDNPGRTS
jgi:hypothetical protein